MVYLSNKVHTFCWCLGGFGYFSSGAAKELFPRLPLHRPLLAHNAPEAACIPKATLLPDGHETSDVAASRTSHHSQHRVKVNAEIVELLLLQGSKTRLPALLRLIMTHLYNLYLRCTVLTFSTLNVRKTHT